MTEEEMVGLHCQINGHNIEQTPGDGERPGSLTCRSWGCKELDMTEQLNNNKPYSSTLAWKIPWMEEPGRLQSMGTRRVGHD